MCLPRSISLLLGLGGLAVHIRTLVVAYQATASFFAILLTFIVPVLSEIYWAIKMLGVNELYSWTVVAYAGLTALVHLINRAMH